jgi:glycosyltransferase involved in cell wall biosynthesis
MPSLLPEPFGNVVHEGMSRGKAIIGTSHGGHMDMIVDGETGRLVPPGDVDTLTAAMAELIADPLRRESLGRAARERSMLFTAPVAIPTLLDTYEAAIRRAAQNGQ